jgi:DNA-binding GntR family transcriptional regulator
MVVTSLSEDDIADIYRVRAVLETAGVAALRDNPRSLHASEQSVASFVRAVSAQDTATAVDADMAFHTSLVALTGSQRLVQIHVDAISQLRLALGRMDLASDDACRQVTEHERLLRDLKTGQVEAALAHLREHLDAAHTQLIAFLRDGGPDT